MANTVYIATSLDGYIARKDGGIDWLTEIPNPEQSDYGFSAFMERMAFGLEIRFELVRTETLNKDLVKSTYVRKA